MLPVGAAERSESSPSSTAVDYGSKDEPQDDWNGEPDQAKQRAGY